MRDTLVVVALLAPVVRAGGLEEKAQSWRQNHARANFLINLRADWWSGEAIEGPRAHRAWNYFQEQLDHGAVRFDGDRVLYALPATHFLSALPEPLLERIEDVNRVGRRQYYSLLRLLPEGAAHWLPVVAFHDAIDQVGT